jgi:gas vesicle protein
MDEKERAVVVVERSDSGLGSFLFGLAIGAGVALLFAPKSGEETRRELRNRGRQLRATAGEKAEELQEILSGGYEDTKSRVEDGIASARQVIEEKRDGAKDAVAAGKAAVHSARDELDRRLSKARRARRTKPEAAEDDGDEE